MLLLDFLKLTDQFTFGTSVQLDPSVCNGWVGAWYPPSNQFQIATRSDGAGAGITHRLLTQDADGTITISTRRGFRIWHQSAWIARNGLCT